MTRVCSGCGEYRCDGRCFLESPADYPSDEPQCPGCDKPFDANGYCAACDEHETPPELLPENRERWVA